MNYTKNYHLPQWVKEDRIMMDDFNQMCKDMEAGLLKTAEDASAEAALVKAGADEAEGRALERTWRLSYNHLCAVRTMEPFPKQMGAVYQDFTESGSVAGMVRLDDHLWTAGNSAALSQSNIIPAISQPSEVNSSSNLCALVFTPPYSGWTERIWLTGGRPSIATATVNASVTLYDLTAGTTEVSRSASPNLMGFTTTAIYHFDLKCFLHAGHQYRLEVRLNQSEYTAVLKWDPNAGSRFELTSAGGGDPALVHRFQEALPSSGGLFLVHYAKWGSGDGLRLDWDGEQYTPYKIRSITDNQGRAIQEAEFRIQKAVPMDSTVTLRLGCDNGAREYCLYDWGGILAG